MVVLYAVGVGPGDTGYLAPEAREILLSCDVIAGYTHYIGLIPELTSGKRVIDTGMKSETERCEAALMEAAAGNRVAVISSGDAGIYGMASLLFELAEKHSGIEIEVIPGITAAAAAAAVLGAPISNDFAAISLSDLLTPWQIIEKRIEAAASGDFVICLYNPRSKKRVDHLQRACDIALKYHPPETCCGYVRNAMRNGCESGLCTLGELGKIEADMFTTVIIGNSATKVIGGKLVTPRGYKI